METTVAKKVDDFFTKHTHQTYKKGSILIRAGDNPSGIFYLKDGLVKEYAISKKGDELVVNEFKPFAFFPMSWAMNDTPNDYFYEAMTNLNVWRAPKEETITFLKQNPDVMYDLLSRVFKGTDGIMLRMTYLMAGSAYARLVTELIIHAKRMGKKNNTTIELMISEKDLGTQSGLTRETVSREVRILKSKNIIDFINNKLVILDLAKLEDELAEGV